MSFIFQIALSLSQEDQDFVDSELLRLLFLNVQVQSPPKARSPLGVTPKKNGKKWLVIDLHQLNCHVSNPSFKMESIDMVVELVHRNDYMTMGNLQDGYFHISYVQKTAHTWDSSGRTNSTCTTFSRLAFAVPPWYSRKWFALWLNTFARWASGSCSMSSIASWREADTIYHWNENVCCSLYKDVGDPIRTRGRVV